MIHIGELIRKRMQEIERTPSWLARKINCDRTNIYKIFQRPRIDTALLSRISKALDHDFFADLSDEYEQA
ncbi:MAG: helix-turn-helix domain-containing protein [Bacteroidaceae bacterium]|nr:helix-turn-helix domain-containing protein [Bacteroidaceae bacterium]